MNLQYLKEKYPDRKIIVVNNTVYDVTDFMDDHPGGNEVIEDYLYKDATGIFNDVGHSMRAKKLMEKYIVEDTEIKQTNQHDESCSDDIEIWDQRYITGIYFSGLWMSFVTICSTFTTIIKSVLFAPKSLWTFAWHKHEQFHNTQNTSRRTPSSVSVVGTHDVTKTSLQLRAHVIDITTETHDSYQITLRIPESIDVTLFLNLGKHIKIVHPDRITFWVYTLVSFDASTLQIVVKRYEPMTDNFECEKMSRFITELQQDDVIELEIPLDDNR